LAKRLGHTKYTGSSKGPRNPINDPIIVPIQYDKHGREKILPLD